MPVIEKVLGPLSALLILSAGVILVLSVPQWSRVDPETQAVLHSPSAIDSLAGTSGRVLREREIKKPPLVLQAEALSLYLNPPKPQMVRSSPTPSLPPTVAIVRPAVVSLQFRLHATCCSSASPKRSRALIWEPGGDGMQRRWVKEGDQIGHFVVQEIRPGVVVCANGGQVHEMSVEHPPTRTPLVKSQRTSLARDDLTPKAEDVVVDMNAVVEGMP